MDKIIGWGLFIVGCYILATSDMGKHGSAIDTLVMIGIAVYCVVKLSS